MDAKEPNQQPVSMTPRDYELFVKGILDASGESISSYRSEHHARRCGTDGEYVIDVEARFSALGAEFLVVIECKHHARKVERSDVQVLHTKIQSLGAHKGILFSISGFQSGAVDYAGVHGIALVQVADGFTCWHTRSEGPPVPPPPWLSIPKYIGWLHSGNTRSLLSVDHGEFTRKFLDIQKPLKPSL